MSSLLACMPKPQECNDLVRIDAGIADYIARLGEGGGVGGTASCQVPSSAPSCAEPCRRPGICSGSSALSSRSSVPSTQGKASRPVGTSLTADLRPRWRCRGRGRGGRGGRDGRGRGHDCRSAFASFSQSSEDQRAYGHCGWSQRCDTAQDSPSLQNDTWRQ